MNRIEILFFMFMNTFIVHVFRIFLEFSYQFENKVF